MFRLEIEADGERLEFGTTILLEGTHGRILDIDAEVTREMHDAQDIDGDGTNADVLGADVKFLVTYLIAVLPL